MQVKCLFLKKQDPVSPSRDVGKIKGRIHDEIVFSHIFYWLAGIWYRQYAMVMWHDDSRKLIPFVYTQYI